MIYKHDTSKRKTFLIKLICFYLLWTVIVSGVLMLMNEIMDAPLTAVLVMIGFLIAVYTFMAIRNIKMYDSVEVELTESDLYVRYKGYEHKIPYEEIRKIGKRPSIIDSKRIIVYKKNYKGVLINSYLENFDEFKTQLLSKTGKTIKSDFTIKLVNLFLFGLLFLAILSLLSKNLLFIIIANSVGSLVCGFDIFRFVIADMKKSRKITHIIIYGVLGMLLTFNALTNASLYAFFDYRKDMDGKKVLMRRLFTHRYDKNGNEIYISDNFNRYKYKYDENNNQIFFHDLTDNYKEWKTYKNGFCVESHDSDGVVTKFEYDENGNQIRTSNNTGYECVMSYDEKGNLISSVSNKEICSYYEYDENGNQIYVKHVKANGKVTEIVKKYDDENRLIYNRRSGELEQFFTYSGNSKITKRLYDGKVDSEETEVFDDNGNCISSTVTAYQEDENGQITESVNKKVLEYDEYNNVIYSYSTEEGFVEYSYDYDKNGKVLRSFSYVSKN